VDAYHKDLVDLVNGCAAQRIAFLNGMLRFIVWMVSGSLSRRVISGRSLRGRRSGVGASLDDGEAGQR